MIIYKLYIKRIIDFTLSGLALIILSPIILILWIWLTFANKGVTIIYMKLSYN